MISILEDINPKTIYRRFQVTDAAVNEFPSDNWIPATRNWIIQRMGIIFSREVIHNNAKKL